MHTYINFIKVSLYLALQLIGDTPTKNVYKRVLITSYLHLDINLKYTNYKICIKILSKLYIDIFGMGYLELRTQAKWIEISTKTTHVVHELIYVSQKIVIFQGKLHLINLLKEENRWYRIISAILDWFSGQFFSKLLQKSKFLQAWVLKFSANVQARSSVVWFLKQSKQMCLLQSPQATLHHVSLFPLNSAYSDLWRTLWANALLLGAQNLCTIAVLKNLRSVTSQDLTEKPVGFLIGDVRTVSPKYVYLRLQCPQRTARGNATTFVIFF